MQGQMKALLGVLAVYGFQHRDQIVDALKNVVGGQASAAPQADGQQPAGGQQGGLGGLLGGLGGMLGGGSAGGILSGGLGGLLEQFQKNGQGDVANSWVSPGDNQPIDHQQLIPGAWSRHLKGVDREYRTDRAGTVEPTVSKPPEGGERADAGWQRSG